MFPPDEELAEINLRDESRIITEKKTFSPLLWPRLLSLAIQQLYTTLHMTEVRCSERDTQNWTQGVGDKVFKAYVMLFGVL